LFLFLKMSSSSSSVCGFYLPGESIEIGSVTINGKKIIVPPCSSFNVHKGHVYIDGVEQKDFPLTDKKEIKIEVHNCQIGGFKVDYCDKILFQSSEITTLTSASADIKISGDLKGNLLASHSDVNCKNILGSVTCSSGNITAETIQGSAACSSGDITAETIHGSVAFLHGSIITKKRQRKN